MFIASAIISALATVASVYGNWFVAEIGQLIALFCAFTFVVGGIVIWCKGERRALTAMALPGLLFIAPIALFYHVWSSEHDAFHALVDDIRRIQGSTPGCIDIARHPRITPYLARIRGLDFEPARVVWRFYSTRRNEVYDCVRKRITFE